MNLHLIRKIRIVCVIMVLTMISSFASTINAAPVSQEPTMQSKTVLSTPTTLKQQTSVSKTTPILYGDNNGDGSVDSADYTVLRRYLLKIIDKMPNPAWEIAADVNMDCVVDSADYTMLRAYLLEKISSLPPKPVSPTPTYTPTPTVIQSITPTNTPRYIELVDIKDYVALGEKVDIKALINNITEEIKCVEFYTGVNGTDPDKTTIATDDTAPYSCVWEGTGATLVSWAHANIYAKATTVSGKTYISDPESVTVFIPTNTVTPTSKPSEEKSISIVSPKDGEVCGFMVSKGPYVTQYPKTGSVKIVPKITTDLKEISNVEYYVDDNLLGTVYESPYEYEYVMDLPCFGDRKAIAVMNLKDGTKVISNTVNFQVVCGHVDVWTTPTVTISPSPTPNTIPEYYLSTLNACDITSTSATLGGSVIQKGMGCVINIVYWEKNNPDNQFLAGTKRFENAWDSNQYSVKVTGLKPNTEYEFGATNYLVNTEKIKASFGGHEGYVKSFKTLENVITNTPTITPTSTTTPVIGNSISIVSPKDGEVCSFMVYMGPYVTQYPKTGAVKIIPEITTDLKDISNVEYYVDDKLQGTVNESPYAYTYEMGIYYNPGYINKKVVAVMNLKDGKKITSDAINFKVVVGHVDVWTTPTITISPSPTPNTIPEYYLSTLNACDITSTSATLGGSVIQKGMGCVINIVYWEKNNPDNQFLAGTKRFENAWDSNQYSVTVTGLKPNTEYEFGATNYLANTEKIKASFGGHDGYVRSFKTLE